MHIAFLTPEYPQLKTGFTAGIGTSIKNNAESLVDHGINISLFIYGQKEDAIFIENGIKFHLIKQRKFKLFGWYLHRKFLQNYLNKFIKKDEVQIVEAPDWSGITAFINLICPLIIRLHGCDSYFCNLEKREQKRKNFWFEKLALQGADHLLSVSAFTAHKTKEIFKLNKEIKVIPNSVDVGMFCPDRSEPIPKTILYFGSIIRKKGVLELAHIFNLIHNQDPDVRLIMAGRDVTDITTGRSTYKLFEGILTDSAQKQIVWKGNLPYSEIISEIQKAAVVVLPSFAEALPMTWLEAMAMEKAMVTSNIGWANEVMINGKTGFMVHPEDHKMFADHTLELLQNTQISKEMGIAARMQVKTYFSTEVVAEKNIAYYMSRIK